MPNNKESHIQKSTSKQKPFADVCGILTTNHHVSLEEMDAAIMQSAVERFNRCNLNSKTKQSEAFIHEDVNWGLYGDD